MEKDGYMNLVVKIRIKILSIVLAAAVASGTIFQTPAYAAAPE
jgi:hypothetical protein